MKRPNENLSILVLHRLGDPESAISFLKHHVFSLSNYQPENNYLYHDVSLPLPEYVKAIAFDLIVLDVTLLCSRWRPKADFEELKREYNFVAGSNAVKIAFPQDEYDCNELLDSWMCEWNVDIVFSVISKHWDILYPNYSKIGRIQLGYTGYIDRSLIDFPLKPFNERTIDIGYRARKLPPYFGRIGETKWTIGRDVLALSKHYGLNSDIVLGGQGVLIGNQWLEFINNSKFTLGSNSGSSLLDPRGEIQQAVRGYIAGFPEADFKEVEEHCFKGLDGHYTFTAISPRVLEAAMLKSCQILVEGDYSGLIRPWEHYIPLKEDLSNMSEVVSAMNDLSLVSRMCEQCRSVLLDCKGLHYETRAQKIITITRELAAFKKLNASPEISKQAIIRYDDEMKYKYLLHWNKDKLRRKLVKAIDKVPAISKIVRSVYYKIKN